MPLGPCGTQVIIGSGSRVRIIVIQDVKFLVTSGFVTGRACGVVSSTVSAGTKEFQKPADADPVVKCTIPDHILATIVSGQDSRDHR